MKYRIKDIARINRKTLSDDTDPDYRFRYIDIGAVDGLGNVSIPDEEISFAQAPSRARRLAPAGSVIVSTVRTYLRAIASVPADKPALVFSTGFAVLEAQHGVDSRFLAYYCRSQPFIDEVIVRSVGVSYPAINASEIGNVPISLPSPSEEQRRIADFLDAETKSLNAMVNTRLRQQELVDERREALLSICCSYDGPNCVDHETLGSLNASWPVLPFRRVLTAINVGVVINPSSYFVDAGMAFIHGFNVREGWIDSTGMKFLSYASNEQLQRSQVRSGDVLVVRAGAPGRAAVVPDEYDGANCASVLILRPSSRVIPKFLEAFINSAAGKGQVGFSQYGAAQEVISAAQVAGFIMPVPPIDEQRMRVENLTEAVGNLLRIKSLLKRQVDLLAERRQALITAAVTEQFDVSSASGRGVTDGVRL